MLLVAPFTAAYAAIAAAIAALTAWWGEANSKVHLFKSNTNIDSATVIASFTEGDFGGYAALVTSAVPAVFSDPLTGQLMIRCPPPTTGWKYSPTSTTNLPQTIYGAYLTNNASDKLLGAVRFETPIVLTAVGQLIDLGSVQLPVNPVPLGG